jgi:DNA-binding MarR family transcriptional regulator
MKLKDYVVLDAELKSSFSISRDELHLLSYIGNRMGDEDVTIMTILTEYEEWASQATTHKRLTNLVKAKLLKKDLNEKDTRIKTLSIGVKHNNLVKFLEEF